MSSEICDQQLVEVNFEDWEQVAMRTISSLLRQTEKQSVRQIETKIRQKLMARGFTGDIIAKLMQRIEVKSSESDQLSALTSQGIKAYKKNFVAIQSLNVTKKNQTVASDERIHV